MKLRVIWNIILGRPVMYRIKVHAPATSDPVAFGSGDNGMLRGDENERAIIVESQFINDSLTA